MKKLPNLMLFTPPMMVYSKDDRVGFTCNVCQVQRGQPAITADFQERTHLSAECRPLAQLFGFFNWKEALHILKLGRCHGRLHPKASVYDVSHQSS